MILMKNFIVTSVPEALEEAARMDGANDLKTLLFVVVPMLKPAIATMVVFCSVGYWNNYFSAMMYVSDRKLWPLTLVLRELVVEQTSSVSPVIDMLYLCQSFAYIYIKNGGHYYYCAPNFNRVSVYAAVLCERVSLGSVKE